MDRQEATERIEQNKAAAEFYAQLTGNSKSVDDELKDIEAFNMAIEVLKSEPQTGEWVKNENGTYTCDKCQSWILEEQHHYARYCLYCGAKMKG